LKGCYRHGNSVRRPLTVPPQEIGQSASYRAGCPPGNRAARASPCRNCGIAPAGPQSPGRCACRQIANPPYTPVVPTQMNPPAAPAGRFFARRASVMRRAFGSPKIPRTVGWGRKPGNVYVSHRRRRRFDELAIATSCPIQSPYETQKTQYPWGFKPHFPLVSSTRFPDEPIKSTAKQKTQYWIANPKIEKSRSKYSAKSSMRNNNDQFA
jgi:hypothetical protein